MDAYADLPDWVRSVAIAHDARKRYDAEIKALRTRRARAVLASQRELAA